MAGAKLREEGILVVGASVENFRDAPNGKKLGTLLQGTRVEKISQKGKWVRFRVEGWVWGPSLEGFEEEKKEAQAREEAPRLPLQDALLRIERFVNEGLGVFYSVDLDEDLCRLTVRFRVRRIERAALEQRQMKAQRKLLELLEDEVDFDSIRVETNRPDGTGPVGTEIAQTPVDAVRQYAGKDAEAWKAHTRFSRDGGKTWIEGAEETRTDRKD